MGAAGEIMEIDENFIGQKKDMPKRRGAYQHGRSYYRIFKRCMKGIYQRYGEKHLLRYVAEFDFRYNNRVALGLNDAKRANRAS